MGSIVKNFFIVLLLFMVAAMTADAATEATELENPNDDEGLTIPSTAEPTEVSRSPAVLSEDMEENYLDSYRPDRYANRNLDNEFSDENDRPLQEEEEENFEEEPYSGDFEATYTD